MGGRFAVRAIAALAPARPASHLPSLSSGSTCPSLPGSTGGRTSRPRGRRPRRRPPSGPEPRHARGVPRLFVAVWLPEHVLDLVAALPRPDVEGLRWTSRDQWHVTLRFFGNVELDDAVAALQRAAAESTTA